jgi:hypothetical protein
MADDRSNQKKKAYLYIGILLALLTLLGFFVYSYKKAAWLRPLSHSPIAGGLEITVFLVGLALIGLGGVFGFSSTWKGLLKSFAYEIGLRLVATGYLVALISGLADYIGMGSHHKLPYFGPLQTTGVLLGEAVIAIGFLLMIPYKNYEG